MNIWYISHKYIGEIYARNDGNVWNYTVSSWSCWWFNFFLPAFFICLMMFRAVGAFIVACVFAVIGFAGTFYMVGGTQGYSATSLLSNSLDGKFSAVDCKAQTRARMKDIDQRFKDGEFNGGYHGMETPEDRVQKEKKTVMSDYYNCISRESKK